MSTPDPGQASSPAVSRSLSPDFAHSTDREFNPCDALDWLAQELAKFEDDDDHGDDDNDYESLDDYEGFAAMYDLDELRDRMDDDGDGDGEDGFFAVAPPDSAWIASLRGDDPPLSALQQLDLIRDEIDRLNPAGTSPMWLRIFGSRDASHGRIRPEWAEMEGGLERLMGWKAPVNCLVVGIAAGGRIRTLEAGEDPLHGQTDQERDAAIPSTGRAQTVCILDREGRLSGRTTFPDGSTLEHAPEAGRLPDALRRCFGFATASPSLPSSELLKRMWLGKIAAAGGGGAVALSWDQVRLLHPAVDALKSAGAPLDDALIDAGIKVAPDAWTWEKIRTQAAEAQWDQALIPAELADWMDEGMFSRWVLEGTRPVNELLEAVLPWLAPSARRRLRRALG